MNRGERNALVVKFSKETTEEWSRDLITNMKRQEVWIATLFFLNSPTDLSQAETMPHLDAIQSQTEVQWCMRVPLLDFLLEAHRAFSLLPQTLHLTVNLLDRYCSRRIVHKSSYQLVGCVALLIAAKYGDFKDRVPRVRELNTMCCSVYSNEMFTDMERHFISTLDWTIGHPTVACFQKIFLDQKIFLNGEVNERRLEYLSWYLAEVSLYHKDFIPIHPSVMAVSTLELARKILGFPQPRWPEWATRPDRGVILSLIDYTKRPSATVTTKYGSLSLFPVVDVIDGFLQKQQTTDQRLVHSVSTSESLIRGIARPNSTRVTASRSSQSTRCVCQGFMDRSSFDKPKVNGTNSHSSRTHRHRVYHRRPLRMDLGLLCNFCIQRYTRMVRIEGDRDRLLAK